MMLLKKLAPWFLCGAALGFAQPDPAALQKQTQDLERRERREQQKIDQAEEQERIKLRSREREELARVQRDSATAAGTATATVVATGSLASLDYTKLAQLKFAEDEVRNLIQNQLGAEITVRFDRDRKALERKYTLERAKLEAQQIDAGDDTAKQKEQALKTADVNAKFQEQLDNLASEQAGEEAKLRFSHTTRINAAERDLAELTTRHILQQSAKGSAAMFNPTTDPEYAKLAAARDQARNNLETALDELRAKDSARTTDIQNAKEDELAKVAGG